jgi:hypothetical protein
MRHSRRNDWTLRQKLKPVTLEYHHFKLNSVKHRKITRRTQNDYTSIQGKTVRIFVIEHTYFKDENVYEIIQKIFSDR